MFCVQLAGVLKPGSTTPIIKVHAAKRNGIIREHGLQGMEMSMNDNTGQTQILFYVETEEDVRKFLQNFETTIAPYSPFIEQENRLNIATVTAYHSI